MCIDRDRSKNEDKGYGKGRICSYLPYVLFVLCMVLIIANKKNLHIDEALTYGLANYADGWMSPVNGKQYTPAQSAWLEYVTVGDTGFDYRMVWRNQAGDVHPPLYYALVHTICSLHKGKFSIWYAGSLNLIFAVLTLWIVRRLLEELTQSFDAVMIGTYFSIFSTGILSAVSFLRMYMMVMFEVTFITWLFVRAVKTGCDLKFFITATAVSAAGALTHYYFIVYLFFLCLFFGIYLLFDKQYRNVVYFIVSMSVSGKMAVWIFPDMIRHMFSQEGYRGQESIENLKRVSPDEYIKRLRIFYTFLNEQIFGGILTWLIIIILLSAIYGMIHGRIKCTERKAAALWILMTGPSVCYLFLVSRMAVMMEARYIWPVYAVVLSGGFAILYASIGRVCGEGKKRNAAAAILVSVMLITGWKMCTWEYLFSDSEEFLNQAAQFQSEDAIYIYDAGWKLPASFYEAVNYKTAVFIPADKMEKLENLSCLDTVSLIVCMTDSCEAEAVLGELLERCPLLTEYEEIGGCGYTVTYHLYGQVTE